MKNLIVATFDNWYTVLLFGLLYGSFLNVVIYRIPKGLSISYPPSNCPSCKSNINFYDNIPVLSWLILGGKCRSCKNKISLLYPIIELIHGLGWLSIYLLFGFSIKFFIGIAFFSILLAISIIDLKTFTIPVKLQISLLILAIINLSIEFFYPYYDYSFMNLLIGGLTGFALTFFISFIGKLILKQEALGGGDIFLLGYGGFLIGSYSVFLSFFLGSIFGIIFYIIPTLKNKFMKNKELKLLLSNIKTKNDFYEFLVEDSDKYIPSDSKDELRYFFALHMKQKTVEATKLLSEFNSKSLKDSDVLDVCDEDILGYNDQIFNLTFLKAEAKKYNLPFYDLIKDLASERIEIITSKNLDDTFLKSKSLNELLKLNKISQYSGYTEEQIKIENFLLGERFSDHRDYILTTLAYIFYTDQMKSEFNRVYKMIENDEDHSILFYKLAIYRQYFFRTRLPFGPHLSAGMLISYFFGKELIDLYINNILGF
ncbi:MAG: prepilin peptidase [Candidatus Delongbacteria bacterium]|nr:prepilin peptidase [Candidatus Delongbacteria bacterium]MBN2835856.1 prepilin peptidase [Candidatus Delongbacteria bacterium]